MTRLCTDELLEWERLSAGSSDAPPLPRIGPTRRFRGACAYLRTARLYRKFGFAAARDHLLALEAAFRPLPFSDNELLVRMATREIIILRIVGRCVRQDFLCLPDSLTLAAGLIAAGFPVQVVLGRARYLINPTYDFHAWVELGGVPLNEFSHVRHAFWLLLRVPEWKASSLRTTI